MKLHLTVAASLALLVLASPAAADEPVLIHSDVPLWSPGEPEVWPQHFTDAESFGCTHRLRLGVWRYTSANDRDEPSTWYRFGNYGVAHCWMNVAEGGEPDHFSTSRPGFLVQIGRVGAQELWIMQVGARPGSDYLLLSRQAGAEVIARFEVLQRRCPRELVRGGQPLDILRTDYCGITAKDELLGLTRRMAKLPRLGTLTFEGEAPNE